MSADDVDAMLALMKSQERISLERAHRDEAHLGLAFKAVALREKQITVLEELVAEIRRLRVTGLQP